MITPGLEKLIQEGKAQAHTWVHGAGGVGRIPVEDNQFIVIHHFDFFGFVDLPAADIIGASAVGEVDVDLGLNVTVTGHFNFGFVGNGSPVELDSLAIPATLTAVQNSIAAIAPGWSVALAVLGTIMKFTFTTSAPGDTFNGIDPSFIFIPMPLNPATSTGFKFSGGTPSDLSLDAAISRSVHQLSFRSKKGRNHFVIPSDVNVFEFLAMSPPNNFILNVTGHYKKDCYLVHDGPVQINVLTGTDVAHWSILNFSNLPVQSQEENSPEGYGQAGAGLPALRDVRLNSVLTNEQYLPLTAPFESISPGPTYREQFKFDTTTLTRLRAPGESENLIVWNKRSYPVINIDYVKVNKNQSQFVLPTNG